MRVRLIMLALLFVIPVLAADVKPEPSPEPPSDKPKVQGPFLVRLIANKKNYTLDRQGMTAEKYGEAIRAGKIPQPNVDLVLEFTNVEKEAVDFRITGAVPKLTLKLDGKGGIVTRTTPREGERVSYATIQPGETCQMALTHLTSYVRGQNTEMYWTEPGEYALSVTFHTALRTPPAARLKVNPKGRIVPVNPPLVGIKIIPAKGGIQPVPAKGLANKGAKRARGTTTFTTETVKLTVRLK